MHKIFIFGILGKMGLQLVEAIKDSDKFELAGGFDSSINLTTDGGEALRRTKNIGEVPVYGTIREVDTTFDAIIDFSSPSALSDLVYISQKRRAPIVEAVTGYAPAEQQKIRALANLMPIFMSSNMSAGVHAILNILPKLARACDNYDIEIVEKHHNQKKDAPSGTALMLCEKLNPTGDSPIKYGREPNSVKRKVGEIGIHAVRGGGILGEHEILLCGQDELITVSHSALSRKAFAAGALRATEFIISKKKGLYHEIV